MIITITMSNIVKRGQTYYFRMAVPDDCREAIGKSEITKSLKTEDKEEAALLAKKETSLRKKQFKEIRSADKTPTVSPLNTTPDVAAEFREKLTAYKKQHLQAYLDKQSDKGLKDCAEFYLNCLFLVRDKGESGGFDLSEELGISFPLPEQKTPGITRKLSRILSSM